MKHPAYFETDEQTSRRMSNVKLKHGDAETALAKALWHRGYRYRLNYKKLPGSPDIAILRYKIAVFVDGEFWHGFDWVNKKDTIKRNRAYWVEKIEENMSRDVHVDQALLSLGWLPVHFWSKEVEADIMVCVKCIDELIIDARVECMEYL